MKLKKTLKSPLFILIILIFLFIGGWILGKTNPSFFKNFPSFINTKLPHKGYVAMSLPAQQNLVDVAFAKLEKLLATSPNNLALLINCTESDNKDCKSAETQRPPYQWIQYAKANNYLVKDPNANVKVLLDDLNNYAAKDFDWRLYQYGDILLNKPSAFPELEKKYLEITDKLYTFTSLENVDFKFYTEVDKPKTNLLEGSIYGNKTALLMAMMDYGTRLNTVANAYAISNTSKYRVDLTNLLNVIHGIGYYEVAISPTEPELKSSTCYTILADVYAYKATKDRTYLGFIDYLNSKEAFNYFYDAETSSIAAASKDPMKILPCLDAMQQLAEFDLENTEIHNKNYDLILAFLFKNEIIVSDTANEYYGFAKMADGKYDVNSTAWLIKIMSSKLRTANQ